MVDASPTERREPGVVFRILVVLVPIAVLLSCGLVLFLVFRPEPGLARAGPDAAAAQPPGPPAGTPLPLPGATPPTLTPGLSPEQAMATRYRPGPFVKVVGMLPSARAQGGAISWLGRQGRTVDTPWLVRYGEVGPSRAPSATAGGDRPVLAWAPGEPVTQPVSVVPGAPNWVRIRASHPVAGREIKGLHVAFGDYLGHFFLPSSGMGQDGEVGTVYAGEADTTVVEFGLDTAVMPTGQPIPPGQPYPVTMYIGAEDADGNVSDYLLRQLQVMPVGTGDVEVTLTMTQATDLDLYVIEPTAVAIYYRNTSSFSGGHLDLDANAACSSNVGVNNEHIFWPRGMAPAGIYTVRVANFTSCIGGGQVNYQVTVRNCGETAVFTGGFVGQGNRAVCTTPPGLDQGWCQDVVTFQVTPCAQ